MKTFDHECFNIDAAAGDARALAHAETCALNVACAEAKTQMEKPMTLPQPERFDTSVLPDRLRLNWRVCVAVRKEARERYAYAYANAYVNACRGVPEGWDGRVQPWRALLSDGFEIGLAKWNAANPLDPVWRKGVWPLGSNDLVYPEVIEEARVIMARANKPVFGSSDSNPGDVSTTGQGAPNAEG